MKDYGPVDEHTPLTSTTTNPNYVYMTNPNRMYRKQVHQFQCCICAVVITIIAVALTITILYSVDQDKVDINPDLPADNASLEVLLSQSWPLPDDGIPVWQLDPPTPQEVEAAVEAGKASLKARDSLEASNPSLPVNSPSYRHQVSIKTSARATYLARSAYVMEVATQTFILPKKKPKNLTKTVGRGPILTSSWLPTAECGKGHPPSCPASQYRTVDGSCNNPYKPNDWGVAMRPYRRQLASDYADGVSKPRVASDGSPLPSARAVSVTVHRPVYRDDPKFTVMFAVWGQFMDHDITATANSIGAFGKPISCCQNASHPECFPVYLSKDDPYYKQFGMTCMEFVRSAPAATCAMGPREQLNQVSSYLDGSVVYGNTPELSRSLRSYQGGQLKMLETPDGRTLLPISTNLEDGCNREEENAKGKYCFMTGDFRANENTHLTSLHLLLARQHNLLASQLTDLNPDWNDEKIYQEARKIVGAQMQHITYNEFLPVLLGPEMMSQLDLNPEEAGYYEDYDPNADATVSNNFATSAFRFAHTLLPALMKTVAKDWASEESVEMHKLLFDPFKLYQTGALDKMLQGAISTRLERADSYFNTQVTQHLFQATGADETPSAPRYGLDLVSLNVQRGRDHGLPGYPVWREYCGLPKPKTFKDMETMVDNGSLERMKALYKTVDDIDMYTGALSEFPIEGGLVGPTVTCLVTDQFKRLKQGDRFWYETDKQPQAFKLGQLKEIRKTTLAGVICDTSDEVTMVQPEVMRSVSSTNARVPCSALPRLDISKWVEPNKELKTSVPGTKYTRIGVSVTGGSIKTSSGDILWDGTVPVVIPVPFLSVKTALGSAGAATIGHGIQWQGATSLTSNGIEVSGMFSYPVYSHGPIPLGTNYTVKWVNGKFTLNSIITSNYMYLSQLTLPGTYESPIFFSERTADVKDLNKQYVLGATDDSPVVIGDTKLPVILVGSYSPDRTSFYWNGNATITIPNDVPSPTLSYLKESKNSSISGLFNIVSGNIKLDSSDGSSTVVWSGDLPVAIPLPSPNTALMATETGEKLMVLGKGLVWSASISGSLLEGSFSFPQFNTTFSMLSVNWLGGQFSLKAVPIMNSTLEELLTPGVKYTSRIILRQEQASANLQLNSLFNDDMEVPGSLENLVVESQEVLDGIIPAPLILFGTLSPDKTTFYFNGKVVLAVKPSKPKIDKQLKSLKSPELSLPPWGSLKFGGAVNSGHITVGVNGGSSSTVWAGTVPVAIPMPTFFSPIYDSSDGKSFLFSNGVVWSGTQDGSTIKGTFSLQQSDWSMTGIKQQTWTGEFSFELRMLWNTTLGSVFVPGAKYYSKIHFQGAKYEAGLSSMNGVPGEDPAVAMSAPIILQGNYSPDQKTFYWSGGFIVVFRNKPSLMFIKQIKKIHGNLPTNPLLSLMKTKSKPQDDAAIANNNNNGPKTSASFTVITGQLSASNGSEPIQFWGGEMPVEINTDMFNPTKSPGAGVSVTWSASSTSPELSGTFSVTVYFRSGSVMLPSTWTGNFSLHSLMKWGGTLDSMVKPGEIYTCSVIFKELTTSSQVTSPGYIDESALKQFVLGDGESSTTPCTLILNGKSYVKNDNAFYCKWIPFICSNKPDTKWFSFNGDTILVIKKESMFVTSDLKGTGGVSSKFVGQVVSGKVEGGLTGNISNVWWSGDLPIQIPTSIFVATKTGASSDALMGSRMIEWSGTLAGNTLKGTFSFPQLVLDFPVPSVQWWSGQFSFNVEPLWNTSLDGLIQAEAKYSSGIHFQGLKTTENNDNEETKKQNAPIVLQGTFSPDGSTFLWSGKFIMSVRSDPTYPPLSLMKTKSKLQDGALTKNNMGPKTSASFTVITGQLSASNGSEPIQFWGGEMPVEINTDMFNPTKSPGAGVSVTWSASSTSPELSGTFSVTVYFRSGSVMLPSTWTGNFSLHSLMKWGGTLDSMVKPGEIYTCSVIFKELTTSSQVTSPGYIDESALKQFVLGDGESSTTPCTLILNGKSYVKNDNAFYCKWIPFICSIKPDTTWFSFNGDTVLVIKSPANISPEQFKLVTPAPVNLLVDFPRRINTTVISGSIVAAPESQKPTTLWSGSFPLNIPLPVFWNSESPMAINVPIRDVANAHSVIWSGSQFGPRVEGSFSLPQYSKAGVTWWTGQFTFLFQTSWGALGDLDGLIQSGITYNSRIIFRDIRIPESLQAPSQININESTSMPIILLGTYSPDRKVFYWSGSVVIAIRSNPGNLLNNFSNLQLKSDLVPGIKPMQPNQKVGVKISSGSLTNSTGGNILPLWSGSIPVKIPLERFNISKGVNIIWSATTLYPKLTGTFSIPQYDKYAEDFKIEWIDGTFSFDLMPLWNTSLDVIEIGKQYATIVSANSTKLTKEEQADMQNSFLSLIMESAGLKFSPIGFVNLKGSFTPDNMYFTWLGEAWFYQGKNQNDSPKQLLPSEPGEILRANQFGGAVFDGYVTAGTSSFFSLSHTIWSGYLPAQIPLSAFWPRTFSGGSLYTGGVSWTVSSVTESILAGSYSVPQYSWDGMMTSVTWYSGDFKFYLRPLWSATLASLIQPGTQYYSRISFQGQPTPKVQSTVAGPSVLPGIPAPIVLQGTYSPDGTSFLWSGNFVLNVHPPNNL